MTVNPEDIRDAEEAWQTYKRTQVHLRRRQMRKRELVAGYLVGVAAERSRQKEHVHPAIMQMQYLIDVAEMAPEAFEAMKRQNPEAMRKLHDALNKWKESPNV